MSDVDELHDQDAAVQQVCDAKMKSVNEILELLAPVSHNSIVIASMM